MKSNPHRETDFHFDKLIIGSSVEAMVTAFKYEIPIIGDIKNKPLPHYYIPVDLDLSPIYCENNRTKFTYLSNKVEKRGMQSIELWDTMFYRLSMMGLAPFWGVSHPDLFTHALHPKGHEHRDIRLAIKNKIVNISYDQVILFDYPKPSSAGKIYYVNDYIDIRTIYDFPNNLFLSKDCDFLETLAYETIFYKRTAKLHGCCVKSIIAEEKIDTWQSSQSNIRMKAEQDIFWNINKNIKIELGKREKAPMLHKMCESLEDIIHHDIMDAEVYDST